MLRPRPPLKGLRVAVTREAGRGESLARLLRARGARILRCPVIRTVRIPRPPGLGRARGSLAAVDWIVFTSANGVSAFFAAVPRREIGRRTKLAAIGPGTAGALRRASGRAANLVPRRYVAESLSGALGRVKGMRVLIPRAAVARDVLPRRLRARGARVTVLCIYRTRPDRAGISRLRQAVRHGRVTAATFTSSSTVDFSMRALGAAGRGSFRDGRVAALSIGPVTSASLRKWGIRPAAEARPHTLEGLAAAAVSYYMKSRT